MKIKPLHIYILIFAIAIVTIIIVSNQDSVVQTQNVMKTEISPQQNIPSDEVHQGLGADSPSSTNVSPEYTKQLNELKNKYAANPNDNAVALEYARFLTSSHKTDESLPIYKKLIENDPRNIDLLMELNFVYYQNRFFDDAIEITSKILEIDPDNLEAMYNIGAIYAVSNRKEEAVIAWGKLLNDYPGTEAAKAAKESIEKIKN